MPTAQVAKALGIPEADVARAVAQLSVTGFDASAPEHTVDSTAPQPPGAAVPQRDVHAVTAVTAAATRDGLAAFVGTWRRVSGTGPETLKVATWGENGLDSTTGDTWGGPRFTGVNTGPTTSAPWHGNSDAPGGTVVSTTETTLKDSKLQTVSNRVESPGLFGAYVPVDLRERTSFELKDGKLVYETEAALFHKTGLVVGAFDRPTHWNTTNLASPERPLTQSVYERA